MAVILDLLAIPPGMLAAAQLASSREVAMQGHDVCELLGKVLSFAGGAVLTWDALQLRKNVEAEHGGQILLDMGAGKALEDQKGMPLDSESAWRLWHAQRPLRRAWIGFLLMALGFLLEIVGWGLARV